MRSPPRRLGATVIEGVAEWVQDRSVREVGIDD